MTGLLVDTGFLVALFDPSERLRSEAREFLRSNRSPLFTVAPVIVETCFFVNAKQKAILLDWVGRGAMAVAEVPVSAYQALGAIILKYADRDIDFADAALVWHATETGMRGVLTLDEADFGMFRFKGGKKFEMVRWYRK